MKILAFDIETSPHLSFHFGRWKLNIPPECTVEESAVLCIAAQWLGSKQVEFMSRWDDGQEQMLERIYELLDEADVVVHYNGTSFDCRRLNAEFIKRGWSPPSPYQQVDLFRTCKNKFGFSSHKLKHVLKDLGLTPKLEDDIRMKLWIDVVYREDPKAMKLMRAYNIQDTKSTLELYDYILGWIDGHPNWGLFVDDITDPDNPVCPNCGHREMKKHKVRRTQVQKYRQWHCGHCGKYSRGRRALTKLPETEGVVR